MGSEYSTVKAREPSYQICWPSPPPSVTCFLGDIYEVIELCNLLL